MMAPKTLHIATRNSPLALWQAHHIQSELKRHWPDLHTELVPLVTSGDRFLQNRLAATGGKGLFVKELEEALLDNRADIAVHSMKDVPSVFPEGLELHTICQRDNPFDALVSLKYSTLDSLPQGAVIGTSSLRRQSQLLARRPDFRINTLRGNINTRLSKLDAEEYDAIILAASGLKRMNFESRISQILNETIMLPACGQGALGIECRANDSLTQHYLAPLSHEESSVCVHVEREVNANLSGGCHTPVGIYCHIIENQTLHLSACVLSADGALAIQDSQQGPLHEGLALAKQCAANLLAKGADKLLGTK